MAGHTFKPSTLGHGTYVCTKCHATDNELAAIGRLDRCSGLLEPIGFVLPNDGAPTAPHTPLDGPSSEQEPTCADLVAGGVGQ